MRITTREELIEVIRLAKDCEQQELTLFTAYKHLNNYHPCVMKLDDIHLGTPIHSDGVESEFLYFRNEYGWNYESLQDRNIPENHYNETYWFTTEEEAKDYIDPTPKSVRVIRTTLDAKGVAHEFFDDIISSLMLAPNSKIPLIKMVRMTTGHGLKESKDYVEYIIELNKKPPTLGDILAEALNNR